MTDVAEPVRGSRDPRTEASLSLEVALVMPVVFLLAVTLLQVVTIGRDVLLAQEVARVGARTAATTTSDALVYRAVEKALDDREVFVHIAPAGRRSGRIVTVSITLTTKSLIGFQIQGRASAMVEPGVGT